MDLLLHVIIALISVIYTAYIYFSPTHTKLRVSYALAGLTLASGTYLVVQHQAYLLHACVSGLIYLGAVFFGIALARRKLAASTATL